MCVCGLNTQGMDQNHIYIYSGRRYGGREFVVDDMLWPMDAEMGHVSPST